jgi:hypothetical protein
LRKIGSNVRTCLPARLLGAGIAGNLLFTGELTVDDGLQDVPCEIGQQQDDDGIQHAAQKPRRQRIARGQGAEVEVENPGNQERTTDQQRRAQAALQRDGTERRHGVSAGFAARGAKQVRYSSMVDADRDRQQQHDDADVERYDRARE